MKKLFTLAAAVLASFSLWAVDPTYQSSEWATQADAEAALGVHEHVTLAQSGLGYGNLGSNGSFYFIINNQTLKFSDQKYLSVVADENYLIDSVSIWYCENGDKATSIAWVAWGEGVTPGENTLAHGETDATTGGKKLENAKWVTIDVHSENVQTIYLARKISGYKDAGGNKISDFGNGQTFNILGIKVWIHKTCTDPEFTVSPTEGIGFVGDPIDITVSSKNQSKPINPAVTVDGVPGVYGTDYTFSASTGLVQATPLKAGTFVVTFSQKSDGTYCDAEESATFVISAKNPVTSFEIDAPATARIGEEITITLSNFDAEPTEIHWYDKSSVEIVAAQGKKSYTFNAPAEEDYLYIEAVAWNDFNTEYNKASNNVDIAVTVGKDASLSDLKVNGTTIDGFAADKDEYNYGQIGVYETLNVVATAADAPYAQAVVTDNKADKVTVTVTAQNEDTKDYVINYTRAAATELTAVSAKTVWDFSKAGTPIIAQLTDETLCKKTEEFVYADMVTGSDASFNAAAIAAIAEYPVRESKYAQGPTVHFKTTVAGYVSVEYSNTGNRTDEALRRFLTVNGTQVGEGTMKSSENTTTYDVAVPAGDVTLTGVFKDADPAVAAQYLRFYKVTFSLEKIATAIDNTEVGEKAVKVIENGQLVIIKNGVKYNTQGAVVK